MFKSWYVIVALFVALLIGAFVYGRQYTQNRDNPDQSYVVKTISYKGETGKSALDLLQKNHIVVGNGSRDIGGNNVVDVSSITGVTMIDGVGQPECSWSYYIDDKEIDLRPANEYQTAEGQFVEWKCWVIVVEPL